MKSILALLLISNIFLPPKLFSQNYTFQDYLYSPVHDIPVGACPAVGGGYIIGVNPHALVKLEPNGLLAWSKDIQIPSISLYYTSIAQSSDSAYLMCGYLRTQNSNSAGYDESIIVTKTDTIGNIIWTSAIDSTSQPLYSYILSTPGGGALMVYTELGPPQRNIMLARFSGAGVLLWHKRYSISSIKNVGYAVTKTDDGGYAIVSKYDAVGFVLKVDSLGNQVWTQTSSIPITMSNNMTDIARAGSGYAYLMLTPDLYFIDANGSAIASKHYTAVNGTMNFTRITETSDDGLIVSGRWVDANCANCPFLMKTDSIGNIQWSEVYYRNFCYPIDQFETDDGGYFMVDEVVFNNTYKSYAVKTNAAGSSQCNDAPVSITTSPGSFSMNPAMCVITNGPTTTAPVIGSLIPRAISDSIKCEGIIGINEIKNNAAFSIYPNPTEGNFVVKATKGTIISVYDMQGKLVLTEVVQVDLTQMDISSLAEGLYAVIISDGKRYSASKLVKN